ncbi:hypothetical protein C8R47DRAFT_1101708 [Mycena vitilis]|nr:hypothetical protein C8R47DRAFT_1101708 [Mycena vitilis]
MSATHIKSRPAKLIGSLFLFHTTTSTSTFLFPYPTSYVSHPSQPRPAPCRTLWPTSPPPSAPFCACSPRPPRPPTP